MAADEIASLRRAASSARADGLLRHASALELIAAQMKLAALIDRIRLDRSPRLPAADPEPRQITARSA